MMDLKYSQSLSEKMGLPEIFRVSKLDTTGNQVVSIDRNFFLGWTRNLLIQIRCSPLRKDCIAHIGYRTQYFLVDGIRVCQRGRVISISGFFLLRDGNIRRHWGLNAWSAILTLCKIKEEDIKKNAPNRVWKDQQVGKFPSGSHSDLWQ